MSALKFIKNMPDLKTGYRLVRCVSIGKNAKVYYLELSEKPALSDYQSYLEKDAGWKISDHPCEKLPTAFADWLTLENFDIHALKQAALRRILNNNGLLTLLSFDQKTSHLMTEFLQNLGFDFVQSIEFKDGRSGFLYKLQQVVCCGTKTVK